MEMPIEQGGILALLMKYKFFAYAASLAGAVLIALTDPPKTRKELFTRVAAAMIASALFGNLGVTLLHNWIDVDVVDLIVPVYGFVGGMGWGIAGAISSFSKRFAANPVQAVKDVKEL